MNLLNRYRESNFNTDHKKNSWCNLLMYIIQASQKEIKKQFLVFKSSFEYCVLSWGVSDLQMNLNLDTMITLTFATFQKKLLHCLPLSVSLVLLVKYFIHMLALEITLLDFSLLINAFLNKSWDLWLFSHSDIFFKLFHLCVPTGTCRLLLRVPQLQKVTQDTQVLFCKAAF